MPPPRRIVANKERAWHLHDFECNGLASAANAFLTSLSTGLSWMGAT